MEQNEYIKQLENSIKQFLQPVKGVPFNLVIEALSNKKVIDFDENNIQHQKVLKLLTKVSLLTSEKINEKGIERSRPNEVGNDIEKFVKEAFMQLKIEVETPSTLSRRKKATGYPDMLFWYKGSPYYLECKTYNKKNINTTQRSFYLSPSKEFKVIYDTIHFCLSFEIFRPGKKFKVKGFKILSLEKLLMDVKHEFNSDNKRLYSNQHGAKILFEKIL